MARVPVPVTPVSRDGAEVDTANEVPGDSVNGHLFVNDGSTFLSVRNFDGVAPGPQTVTIHIPRPLDGSGPTTDVINLAAVDGARYLIGPFPKRIYNQADGRVYVDVSDADVKLEAYSIGA
jgi:hypothetical protein